MEKKDRYQPYWYLLLLSVFLCFLSNGLKTKSWFQFLERPVLRIERNVTFLKQRFGDSLNFFSPCRQWQEESDRLKKDLTLNLVGQGKLAVCEEENEAMRRLLAAPLPPAWHFIPAKMVSFYQQLKLNIGEKAGVETGMMVVSENILIGKISAVQKHSSVVTLVTDPTIKIPVIVRTLNETGIKARGVLSGYRQDQMVLEEILVNEEIGSGALVFSSGEGDYLPDLLVGRITKIEASKEKVFKRAWVEPLVNFSDLRYLFVIKVTQPQK